MTGASDVGRVFDALADPTRRWVVEQLSAGSSITATELAGHASISRQAAAKHLGVLVGAGLLASERSGRETHYQLRPERLRTAREWLRDVGDEWDRRMAALQRQLGAGP
jgi:DNA-binding transcriptional ArsR family regulator